MQQLPEPLVSREHACLDAPKCDACGLEAEYEDNIILQCDGPCHNYVHQACAGVMTRPRGSWVCQLCAVGEASSAYWTVFMVDLSPCTSVVTVS